MVFPDCGYKSHCDCQACSTAKQLFWCEDEQPMRRAWEGFWLARMQDRLPEGRVCDWQLWRFGEALKAELASRRTRPLNGV